MPVQEIHETNGHTPAAMEPTHPYAEFVNPRLARALGQLRLDKRFVRGQGCYLYDAEGRRYLDFLAQYGALPFGFNHPDIWAAVNALQTAMEPSFVQPSLLGAAGELAERLTAIAPKGLDRVTYANSGAEAVEAAIKLCRAATGRMKILAASNGFHGKTLGALSATNKPKYQKAFGAPVEGFEYVEFGDAEALRQALAGRDFAAFLVEPIQGEGGIVEAPTGYLREVQTVCRETGTLFVADEIQTGLGRTGALFACSAEGVEPDVMTLAKALGGGLVPIGAVLARSELVTDEFALNHTSTFAGNALACRVGLATLDLLERDNRQLIDQVRRNGEFMWEALEAIRARYPDLLSDVRGRGYMLGVRFGLHRGSCRDSLLGSLGETDFFAPLVASHILERHGVRLGCTLNHGGVLRIEPPLIATWAECDHFLDALESTLYELSRHDTAQFTSHITGFEPTPYQPAKAAPPALRIAHPKRDAGRFAFLFHPLTIRNYADADLSLQQLSTPQLERLARCVSENFDPFVVGEARIESPTGQSAHGQFIVVPRTADDLTRLAHREAITEIRMAAELARAGGAEIIGLGGFVSVVSRGGLYLKNTGLPALTTGNSYTSLSSEQAIEAALAQQGRRLEDATVTIVGATGSIGRAMALLLSPKARRLALIGNPQHAELSRRRLAQIAAETRHPERTATDCDASRWLPLSDVIITATSAVGDVLGADDLPSGSIVCDISRPPNVSRDVRLARPDVTFLEGGVVQLPKSSELSFRIDLDPGQVYACMAETMLLALERRYQDTGLGLDLDVETACEFAALADRHGFRVPAAEPALVECAEAF